MTLLGRVLHSHQIVIAIRNYEQQQTLIGIIYVVQIKVLTMDMEEREEIITYKCTSHIYIVQRESHKIVCVLEVIIITLFDTISSLKDPELV